jgi:hypothetical protein
MVPFKPGQSGNPAGRAKEPEWLKGIKQLPLNVAAKLWSKWLSMDAAELKKESDNWKTSKLSVIELGMARALQRDIESGEFKNFELALSRIVGRVKDAMPPGEEDLSKLNQDELLQKVRTALSVLDMNKGKDGAYTVDDGSGVHLP